MGDAPNREAVRRLHNEVARSEDPAQASARPPASAHEISAMVDDVLTKLTIGPSTSVCEMGCGTGVLALPIARRAKSFIGLDFADEALSVLQFALERDGLAGTARTVAVDVLDSSLDDLRQRVGTFDRVLLYAVLNFAGSEKEGAMFVERVVGLLNPGGVAMLGNLPLDDIDGTPLGRNPASLSAARKAGRLAGWITRDLSTIDRGVVWRARAVAHMFGRQIRQRGGPAFETSKVAAGVAVPLSRARVEAWVRATGAPVQMSWLAPDVRAPLSLGRADLLLRLDG